MEGHPGLSLSQVSDTLLCDLDSAHNTVTPPGDIAASSI